VQRLGKQLIDGERHLKVRAGFSALGDSIFRLQVAVFLSAKSSYDQGSMRVYHWTRIATALLICASAFGQTDQPSSPPQSTAQPSANKTSPPGQTNNKCPCKPRTVVDAANASKQKVESETPAKVYRSKDLKGPAVPSVTSEGTASPALVPKSTPAAQASPQSASSSESAPLQSPASFKAQGDVYRNQILLEKEKVADIQSRITDLKYQFDEWSTSVAQDPTDASLCWTSSYSTPYYKDWCDAGRNLKAQYDAAQGQIKQENANLEKMQEAIRRKGYGNAVYDPDWP
jgi:hypothetical protein